MAISVTCCRASERPLSNRQSAIGNQQSTYMSTLLIEGGRRLSGTVEVEGNKNAALPLLAACLLTTEECVLTNVPRIRDVEVMAQLLVDLGAQVDGIGTTTLRVRCPEVVKDEPDGAMVGRLRGSVLLLGPLLRRRGRARLAPPGGDFPGASHDCHASRGAGVDGRPRPRQPGHVLECPDGLKPTSIYLYEASVTGTETALLAAAAAPGVTEIRHAAQEPHVVELCEFLQKLGVGITGAGTSTIRVEGGGAAAAAPRTRSGATTSRPAAGRSWRRSLAGRSMCAVPGRTDIEVVAAVLKRLNIECSMEGDVFRVEQSKPEGSRPHHDRAMAWISERPGEPRHGAGDAGRRPDARARLAVRTASVCARAVERHERRPVSLRPAPHHRDRSAQAARASAGQPGSALGHGADRRRARGRRRKPASRRSKPSNAATRSWSIG